MLPSPLYELLPSLYLAVACTILLLGEGPLLWLAGGLLFIAGALTWTMRSRYRRTDLVILPTKRWLLPIWLYETQPFGWLLLGLGLSRLPGLQALWAIFPCLWACRCLYARHHYRRPCVARRDNLRGRMPRRRGHRGGR
jgi:hypothetical protein